MNPPEPLSSDTSDYDSDTAKTTTRLHHHHVDLSNTIFKAYLEINGHDSSTSSSPQDLTKIQSFLNSSTSGALSCLICLERIKPVDPTWSCIGSCFAVFHLHCIQSWAQQSTSLAASRALTRLPISAETAADTSVWNCPKCRYDYPKFSIPKNYYCFCGNLENPPHDPWVLPHSCGEVCGRPLKNNCGHFCLLLCHPGPCPSCPKLVKCRCFCGGFEDVRRCGFKDFSCNKRCNKVLDCGIHGCSEICHDGDCPPCKEKGVYECECGRVEVERECCDWVFRCENPCGRGLECGKHVCERGCHGGVCGQCPFQGNRACPCGKRVYEGMSCDVEVPLCGSTCDKKLSCGRHRCPDRCHRRPCEETCRMVITKACRCGGLRKQIPCHQDLVCERKCTRERDCGRHACRRRCCDGDCPPCAEVCGRKLRCRNHKCPSPCHRGPCAPCPLMVTISCACGSTHFEVPCGTEKEQKPPRCRKQCQIDPLCRHRSTCKPHKCHYGACPPCKLPCGEEYPCGHACKLRCHGSRPPPGPEFTLKPRKKKHNYQSEPTAGTPCPSCPELVWRSCVGQHFAAEKMMICSDRSQYTCDNLCGNPLACGNHYCTKTCHALQNLSSSSEQRTRGEPCEECYLPCQKERTPPCSHPCPQLCHPGECPTCKVLLKRACHCGAMVHVFECIYYNTLSEKEQLTVRSCGGPCHRKLPNCKHLCPETCHPGHCPSPEKCSKKMICSDRSQYTCDNLCGNPLACGNHYCTKTCHALQNLSSSSEQRTRGEPCEECYLPCQKERTPPCSHPCPQLCHPGECPTCKVLLKRACHCGAMVHVFECIYYNTLSEKEQLTVRSCGGPCHRKLPNCKHLCPETCHPGHCPSPEKCSKKVTVRCGCHGLKKEWLCQDVQIAYQNSGRDSKDIPKTQFGLGLLPCDSSCKTKAQAIESELQIRKPKASEKKETETETQVTKRRKRRERAQETRHVSRLQEIVTILRKFVLLFVLVVVLVAVVYFGYKGLLLLNDWMNEVEEQRTRTRYRRS